MAQKRKNISSLALIFCKRSLFLCVLLCMKLCLTAQEGNLYVIANSKGAPDELKFSELKSTLMGEKQRWPNKSKVILVFMKTNTSVGKMVSKKIFDMTPDEEMMFWTRNTFSGKVETPKTCNSIEEFESYLAENPGAIGVTDKIIDNTSLKTVLIDGKKSF